VSGKRSRSNLQGRKDKASEGDLVKSREECKSTTEPRAIEKEGRTFSNGQKKMSSSSKSDKKH